MATKKVENLENEEKKVKKETETKEKAVKKPATSKQTTKKPTTTKSTSKAKTPEKTKKDIVKQLTKTPQKKKIDPKTGKVIVDTPQEKKPVEQDKTSKTVKKSPNKRKAEPKKKSKELTIEPLPVEKKEIVRPTPKKVKELTKEEKLVYKNLAESFSFITNMGIVIEERTMDKVATDNLTIGEIHVIETVNKNNNKPMTLIAKKEHVSVGALTICVNRLVQKGYLERRRDEMDHRIILLNVTQKAKKILKAHDKFHEDILGLVLEKISLNEANKVLNQVAFFLEAYYDPSILDAKPEVKKKKK